MTGVVAVRPLAFNDRAGWEPLFRGYLAFYRTMLPDAQIDLAFRRLLDPLLPMWALVAQAREGGLVGLAHCIEHPSCWTTGPSCYLQDLFVAPQARGAGIGRALIEAVYQAADARGAERVYWLTEETNADARLLYDRIGKASGFIQYRRS
jgi:GNAT superfamily N-acetyltransferase